jgi:HEAT repeat protein
MRRLLTFAAAAFLCAAPAGRASADGDHAEDEARIFYRSPDSETTARMAELISKMPTNSVSDRTKVRREIESLGYWAVDPLIDAVTRREAPFRCAAILVLDSLQDRRAVEPLRSVVQKEAAQQYVPGFAALALGRFRDADSVEVFRSSLRSPKSIDMFRSAAPFALVKIHTPEARDLLIDRVRTPGAKEPARAAALLSLGFFPDAALAGDGARPGPDLTVGLAGRSRYERQAALLGFLVAAYARGDVKQFLREFLASETSPEVVRVCLIGLSRSPDADVTELFARTVQRQGAGGGVRELAADLLVDRVDAGVKPVVVHAARNANSSRVRAACVLALGRVDDEEARRVVLERLIDQAALVRAAAAVSATRFQAPAARVEALAAIEARIKRGEANDEVRADLEKARSLLAGERTDVRWTEVGPDVIFSEMPLTYVQRLMREVNLRLMASLDLAKIQNLQTDSEIVPSGPPVTPTSGENAGGGDLPTGDDPGGDTDGGGPRNPQPSDGPASPPGETPTVGAARTSQYQELRDLKVELIRNPYLTAADLPVPPTTPR